MAQPVWILSVDLQAKTATFTTGLADAAKGARSSFQDIQSGAAEMGSKTGYSMTEARHGVMLLGEEFGVHLPRALSTFLAGLGPIGEAMEAAFPFLAVAALAGILIEHLVKLQAAGVKLTQDQLNFGATVNTVWNNLDQKILQAQIHADELGNNHVAALKHQLELLDKVSFDDLVHSFEELAKDADGILKDLEGHWYTFGKGSEGAKAALADFKAQYESLLKAGKGDEAHGLLTGTLSQAQKVLDLMQHREVKPTGDATADAAAYQQAVAAHQELDALGVKTGANLSAQLAAQQNLVQVLQGQVGAEERIADLKKLDASNDRSQAGHDQSSKAAAAAQAAAASKQRIAEAGLAADRAGDEAALTIHQASLEARLAIDIEYAGRDRDIKLAANQAEVAGLDRSNKDYENQLQAHGEKTAEIEAEYAAKLSELKAKESVQANARDIKVVEQGEREKIDATQEGSAARLAAISAAIKQEEAMGLQSTEHYRELLSQRVQAARQAAEEEAKETAEAGKEESQYQQSMAELMLAATKQQQELERSIRHEGDRQRLAEAIADADAEYNIKVAAVAREIDALDKSEKDYQNKLKQLQNQEVVLVQQHENAITDIKVKAEEERNKKIETADQHLEDTIEHSLTESIMGHQTWARMITQLGDQVVSSMMENALKDVVMDDFSKERDAAKAARMAFINGMRLPFPANLIAAPILAAGAFAAVMAFEGGTDSVPGVGRGDVVPAMLSPGEGIVPGGVMDGLRKTARNGGLDGSGNHYHLHTRVHLEASALDGDGIDTVLSKHADKLQQHFERTLRRMNR